MTKLEGTLFSKGGYLPDKTPWFFADFKVPKFGFEVSVQEKIHGNLAGYPIKYNGDNSIVYFFERRYVNFKDFSWADANSSWMSFCLIINDNEFNFRFFDAEDTNAILRSFPRASVSFHKFFRRNKKVFQLYYKYLKTILDAQPFMAFLNAANIDFESETM